MINDPVLAKQYIENWHAHEQHSEPYERESKPATLKSSPVLGEHTDTVLSDWLGLSAAELGTLRGEGALG